MNQTVKQGDPSHPTAVTMTAGCVVEADYIYMASYLDAHDPRETTFTRLFSYVGRFEDDQWFYHDSDANVVAVCVKKATATCGRRMVALSKEGEVEIYSNKDDTSAVEKIGQAGVRLGSRGYLNAIREIGHTLFACGLNDQVYRRSDDGVWSLITGAPLRIRNPLDGGVSMLNSIDGSSETDVYTCGFNGRLYHYDGARWRQIAVPTDAHLNCVRCVSASEVWVCGNNGTLLVGNASAGFEALGSVDDNQQFCSLTKFKGSVYLASTDDGMFVYGGVRIVPVDTGFGAGLWTGEVDSVPGMLWSFSPKEIACFDGVAWTRLTPPDNPAVID